MGELLGSSVELFCPKSQESWTRSDLWDDDVRRHSRHLLTRHRCEHTHFVSAHSGRLAVVIYLAVVTPGGGHPWRWSILRISYIFIVPIHCNSFGILYFIWIIVHQSRYCNIYLCLDYLVRRQLDYLMAFIGHFYLPFGLVIFCW